MAWISKTGLLTTSEMENNAKLFGDVFSGLGYNINTIAALAGNAQAESTINPGLNEVAGNPPTPTPPTPGKGIPKELIAILQSKRGLHKL